MNKRISLGLLLLGFMSITTVASAQYDVSSKGKGEKEAYNNTHPTYDVETIVYHAKKNAKVKNVILMVGDGMGTSQVYAGFTGNKGKSYMSQVKNVGFSITKSFDAYITDSAAGATAFASGVKTYNGAIGVNPDTVAVPTILELAEKKGLATGLVATCKIQHATPAAFIAHQPNRNMYDEIAADFLNTDIDLFIGGGYKHFADRKDGKDLVAELKKNGYEVLRTIDDVVNSKSKKIAGLVAEDHPGRWLDRGEMLVPAVKKSLEILSQDKDGFFLMVEGSQIDWGGHDNNTSMIVEETMDFDRAVGEVLKFAAKDGETLVIITADHETGGFAINGGNMEDGTVVGKFTTGGHTGVMVPVFAFGPKADTFGGEYQNTAIYEKMVKALKLNN